MAQAKRIVLAPGPVAWWKRARSTKWSRPTIRTSDRRHRAGARRL